MKKPCYLRRLKKCAGTRVLALLVMFLLALEPCVFAAISVYKYPTGSPTISSVVMAGTTNTLYYGSVFGFNSAKSAADADAYAEIREGACIPEASNYVFDSGMEGWNGVAATNISYMYDSALGATTAGSIKAVLAKRNVAAATFTWEKTFFYDCGTPSTVTLAMKYSRGAWSFPGATNNFSVILVRPDLTTKTLVNAVTIAAATMTTPTITQPVTTDLTQVGTYTLRITGTLSTANTNGAKVEVAFDDINLLKAPVATYSSFQQNVELTIAATPVSTPGTPNQYLLDIRAKKPVGDAEATYIQVWDGATWNTRYTVSLDTWTTFNNYYLTPAEYNGGNVRVRYFDATTVGDTSQGGVDVSYQRVGVDTGTCVDSVTDSAADCGKCHNYGGDITKPWPNEGYHNKHAQTESIADCAWCHPSTGYTAEHKNGVVEIDGSKIYEFGTTPTGGTAGKGTYDATTTHQCSTADCHKGLLTPDWFSVEGPGFYQNCSRCHNSGTAGPDTLGNLNIDVAWPNDAGQGHAKHDTAYGMTETTCQATGTASCHPDNRGQHTVVGDGIVVVQMASAYASPNKIQKYIPDTVNGTGTCVNISCHGGQQTPRFNLANTPAGTGPIDVATQCTKCHLAEKANTWGTAAGLASQWNSPLSGLHRGSPPTSGKSHIADYSCTACHNDPVAHFTTAGVSNLASTTMDPLVPADFKAVVGYAAGSGGASPNYTNPPTCSNPAPTTGCHAESDPANKSTPSTWARKWSWDAYDTATPLNQCKSCHGHWTNFTAGVVQPHVTSNSDTILRNALINNHGESGNNCGTMCHGQTDALYNHGVSMTATSKDMSLNTNAGIVKTVGPPARVGCNFCHGANDGAAQGNIPDGGGSTTNHIFAESNWLTDTANAGPAPVCYSGGTGCHGDGVSKSYPTGSSYPNRDGEHTIHMTRLATKLAITLPGTQAQQNTMCQYCHNTLSPGLAGHTTDATANQAEVSSFKKLNNGAADAGTAGTFAAADASCSAVDCHNEKATTATYGWRAAATSSCVMCHSTATTGNNPSSGLHYGATAPTVTGKWHDNTLNGVTTDCLPCHTIPAYSAAGSHMNGTFTGNGFIAGDKTNMGLFSAYTATADNLGSCVGAGVGVGCHAGAGDNGTWARKWNSTFSYLNTGAECAGCHGGFTGTTSWVTGVLNHATDWDGDTVVNEIANKHGADDNTIASRATKCKLCHVYNDATNSTYVNNGSAKIGWKGNVANNSTYHGDGLLNFDNNRTYTLAGGCASNCHTAPNNTNHKPAATSGWTLSNITGAPALSCTDCHTGSGTGAFKVGSTSSHVDPDGTGALTFAGSGCAYCHFTDHTARTTSTIGINWDNRTMGTNYTTDSKIYVKSNIGGTTVTTEAEVCWRCHWGLSVSPQPTLIKEFVGTAVQGTGAYQPGSLNQSNWVGATWTSANFSSYKNGTIASVHQAQGVGTAPAFTTNPTIITTAPAAGNVATLGCTSCHDVHRVGNNGFTPTAAPYLRGSWTSNPFKEDGAPGGGGVSSWIAAPDLATSGLVPRAAVMETVVGNNELGGWQIEQNNALFTNTDYGTNATTSYAGLCSKCHLQSTATVGLEAKWTGHKAAVSGFIGSGGTNVFSSTVRGGANLWTDAHMGHQGITTGRSGSYIGGLRNGVQFNDGIVPIDATGKPAVGNTAIAYPVGPVTTITMDGTTTQTNFHNFPCSKCHSPHASRLPRLMITNCLDVRHNTWDDTQGNPSAWAPGTYTSTQLAYSPTAGNCHRYVAVGDANKENGAEPGWNSVTPW